MKTICNGNFKVSDDAEYEIVSDTFVRLMSGRIIENHVRDGRAENRAEGGWAINFAKGGRAENRSI